MSNRFRYFGLFMMTACGSAPAARPPAEPPKNSPPVAAPAAALGTAASPAPATSAPKPASPFYVIGELPGAFTIYGAGQRGFVADQSGITYALAGDEVVHDPLLRRGCAEDAMCSVQAVAGRWPDAAWLTTTHPRARAGFTKLWAWDGKRWAVRRSSYGNRYVNFIRPWLGGRHLAVEQAGMSFDDAFVVLAGDKNVTVPEFTKSKDPQGWCVTSLMTQAFDTLPSGDVVAAGLRCTESTTSGLGVQRWAPGAKLGTLETLPSSERIQEGTNSLEVVGMALRSASDITVAGREGTWDERKKTRAASTYLAHFDGTRWQTLAWKLPGVVATLDTTSDRSLLVTTDRGELYVGSTVATLALVPFPAELSTENGAPVVQSVWSPAPGDLWAIVQTSPKSNRYLLLHTKPATKPLPTLEEFEQKERAFRLPGPPVEWCPTPFVLLYTLGKKAPADYDYPSTRAALKGHREFAVEGVEFIEFERLERRYFGARVPDFALGKKLADLVEKDVPGATPELVCHDPPPKRTLPIDLTPK